MNFFVKSLVAVGKVFVAIVLLYFTLLLFYQKTLSDFYFGIALLVFVTLPTIFVVYFKTNKIFKIIYILILVLFVAELFFGLYRFYQKSQTQKAIDFINLEKITLNDVMGKKLPPVPDQKLNDSTIAGIDANKNGIRDDVELEIFKEYPNSARIRAAELQYAQALQLELTQISDSVTFGEVMRKSIYSELCIGELNGSEGSDSITTDDRTAKIDKLVINTSSRENAKAEIKDKVLADNLFTKNIEYSTPPDKIEPCDVNFALLPN